MQQRNAIGGAHRLVGIVSHEDGGGARFTQEFEGVLSHLIAQASIEARKGLVHQQDAGRRRQGPGERDPLAFAARQGVRIRGSVAGQPDAREQPRHDPIHLGARPPTEAEGHVRGDGEVRKEGVVLEDHADATALGLDEAAGAGHLDRVQQDATGRRAIDAGDQPQERGLPGPGRAEQAEDFALRHLEGDVAQRRDGTVALADRFERDTGLGRCRWMLEDRDSRAGSIEIESHY